MTSILVLGADTFFGTLAVKALSADSKNKVRVDCALEGTDGSALESVCVSLKDVRTLEEATRGVDVVINCSEGDRWIVVNGMQAILTTAKTMGTKRVVTLSTTAVYGAESGTITEEAPLAPLHDDEEAQLKAEADTLCLQAIKAGQSVIVLRVPILFGAGCGQWAGGLAARFSMGGWGTLGEAGDGICNPLDPVDFQAAIVAAVQAPEKVRGIFNLAGTETLTWNELFRRYNEALGYRPLRPISLNGLGLRFAAGSLLRGALERLPVSTSPVENMIARTPTFRELDCFRVSAIYSGAKAEKEMGWKAKIPFAQTLQDAASWALGGGAGKSIRQPAKSESSEPASNENQKPLTERVQSLIPEARDALQSVGKTIKGTLSGLSEGVIEAGRRRAEKKATRKADDVNEESAEKKALSEKLFPGHIIFKRMPKGGPTVSKADAWQEFKRAFPESMRGSNPPPPRNDDKTPEKVELNQPAAESVTKEVKKTSGKVPQKPTISSAPKQKKDNAPVHDKTPDDETDAARRALAQKMFPSDIIFKKKGKK